MTEVKVWNFKFPLEPQPSKLFQSNASKYVEMTYKTHIDRVKKKSRFLELYCEMTDTVLLFLSKKHSYLS